MSVQIFARRRHSMKFTDVLDAVVGLIGAAIAMAFMAAVAVIVIGFSLAVFVSIFRWIAS